MRIRSNLLCVSTVLLGLSSTVFAQDLGLPLPDLTLCDPFLQNVDDDTEEEDAGPLETNRTRLYDQEIREPLTSEEAVMAALFEEKWDLATRDPIPRTDLCEAEPNYIIHWADVISRNADGKTVLLAEGEFSFKKDGTFQFVFNRRPYLGHWQFADDQMTLSADWINDGEAITAPVEKVQTPVDVHLSDGSTETYYEDAYRIGWIRFLRSETTARGEFQDCACSN